MKNVKPSDTTKTLVVSNISFFEQLKVNLDQGQKVIFALSGNSMLPFMRHGERVVLKPAELFKLGKGDIVLARDGNRFILHRIVSFSGDSVWLAGDGNLMQRELVSRASVWAVVEGVFRGDILRDLQHNRSKFYGMVWFYARPFRLVIYKIFGKK